MAELKRNTEEEIAVLTKLFSAHDTGKNEPPDWSAVRRDGGAVLAAMEMRNTEKWMPNWWQRQRRNKYGLVNSRKASKRKVKPAKAKTNGSIVKAIEEPEPFHIPNYCPHCGNSLQAIFAAINMKVKR